MLPALNMGMQRVDVGAEFHAMCFVFVEIEGVTLNLRVFTLEGLRLSRQSLVLGCEISPRIHHNDCSRATKPES